MAGFEYYKSRPSGLAPAFRDATDAALAKADTEGAWANALRSALEKQQALRAAKEENQAERDFKAQQLGVQLGARAQENAAELSSREGIAARGEAGATSRNEADNKARIDEINAQVARDAAESAALAEIGGFAGAPPAEPPQRIMGAPQDDTAGQQFLNNKKAASALRPKTLMDLFAQRDHEQGLQETRTFHGQQLAQEDAQFDQKMKSAEAENTRKATADAAEQARLHEEHTAALEVQKAKLPKPRDTAIERVKAMGLKPDPGDPLTGRPPESAEAFQARLDARIDAEEQRAMREAGGGAQAPVGAAQPGAPQGQAAQGFDAMPPEDFTKFTTDIAAQFASGKSPAQIAQESGDPQFLAKLAMSPKALAAIDAAQGAAPAGEAPKPPPKDPAAIRDAKVSAAQTKYEDAIFDLKASGQGPAGDINRRAIELEYKGALKEAEKEYQAKVDPEPSSNVKDYRVMDGKRLTFEEAKVAMDKARGEWKARQGKAAPKPGPSTPIIPFGIRRGG